MDGRRIAEQNSSGFIGQGIMNERVCLSEFQLRLSLTNIAQSKTDSAEYLRHLAAKALHCGIQPTSLTEALKCIDDFELSGASVTASQILKDNPKYALPRIYAHGENKIAFSWQYTPEVETLFIIDANSFEMFKIHNGTIVIHRAYVGYSSGSIDDTVAKYIPIKLVETT